MDFQKIRRIITEERIDTAADYHARLGREWRIFGQPKKLHSPLAYSAFEFRVAMERCLLELLYLINNQKLTNTELKYDFGKVVKALYKTQTRGADGKDKLKRRIHFNHIYVKHIPPRAYKPPKNIANLDIEKIIDFWSKLSTYCHRQLKSDDTWQNEQWVDRGYNLVKQVEEYVWEIMVDSGIGWISPSTLPIRIYEVANDFVEGKIDASSLNTRLSLIVPVLDAKDKMYDLLMLRQ